MAAASFVDFSPPNRNSPQPKSPPNVSLVVNPAGLDFGNVPESDHFTWTVPVKNVADEPIAVSSFATSCDCAKVDPPSTTFAPGESKSIRLTLDLRSRSREARDVAERGFAVPFAPILENGNLAPKFEIRGRVKTPLQLPMKNLDIGLVSDDAEAGEALRVAVKRLQHLKKWSARVDNAGWSACVIGSVAQGEELVIHRPAALPAGAVQARLVISSWSSDDAPAVESAYTIRGLSVPDVYASPPSITLGVRRVGETVKHSVSFHSRVGNPVHILRIESLPDFAQAEMLPKGESSTLVLKSVIPAAGSNFGTLRVVVQVKDRERRMEVSVSAHGIAVPKETHPSQE